MFQKLRPLPSTLLSKSSPADLKKMCRKQRGKTGELQSDIIELDLNV
jgi:hypothetical protein